jgi:hypothetical protein
MNGAELEPEEVPELWTQIALSRVLGGRVRCLLDGAVCDGGRAVPDYVVSALRELAGNEHVSFVGLPSGDRLVEITPEGQALFDELGPPQAAVESDVPPLFRLHRSPRPAEDRARFIGAEAVRHQWPRLAFLLDAEPPWTFKKLVGGMLTAARKNGESVESLWVVDERRAGYFCRPATWWESDAECTFKGPLTRLVAFLGASSRVDGAE